ncbi:MAG: DsbE family thiol:disulfide interchange protein [Rhodobacterales bacterium]
MSSSDRSTASPAAARLFAFVPVVIFVTLGAAFYWGLWNSDEHLASTLIGQPVPEFTLPPIEGRTGALSSADLHGEVSIVNVWASWCVPCRVEMPLLVELAATGLVPIHGINHKDTPAAAQAFLAELGDPYTLIGADRQGRISFDWGVYGLPETFVIDANGRIAYKHVGPFNRQSLEQEILPVVRQLQSESGA